MIRLIGSEFLKLRTTRVAVGLPLGLVALILLPLIGGLASASENDLSTVEDQRFLFEIAGLGTFFALVLGVIVMAGEYRHGTATHAFLGTPKRERVVVAKLIVTAAVSFAYALLGIAVTLGIALPWLEAKGIERLLDGGDLLRLGAPLVFVMVLYGVMGVGLGAVLRDQVWAIVLALAWFLLIDAILVGVVPVVGRYTPGGAEAALYPDADPELLAAWAGALLLTAYATLPAVVGSVIVARRDVT